jgi:3-phosphoglycerate kinase
MGRFEVPGFAAGTEAVARAMGRATAAGSTTIVGGEDDLLCCSLL